MSVISNQSATSAVKPSLVPPLQPGDHLTRSEFERRYDATPGLKKAELIEGIVYMPPPVSYSEHSVPHSHLIWWLVSYRMQTPGVHSGDNGSLRLDLDNMPQPDAFLMINHSRGGQARVDNDDYVAGAPELVAEVAASSVSYDLYEKLKVYRRNGVREYIVWRTHDRQVDYFALREGEYRPLSADLNGVVKSVIFPGLWLNAPALIADNLDDVLKVLQQGVASAEHADFVKRLSQIFSPK